MRECAGAASCLCCAGYLGCGLGIKVGAAGCLAGLCAAGAQMARTARQKLVPWLNARNASVWNASSKQDGADGRAAPARGSSGCSTGDTVEQSGVVVELPQHDLEALEPHVHGYLLDQLFPSRFPRCLAEFLEPRLRRWAASTLQEGEATMFVFHLEFTKEQDVPVGKEKNVLLRIPPYPLLVLVDVAPAGTGMGCGPLVRRIRVAISDAEIQRILDVVTEQVAKWDLRELDPRFNGFTQPVQAEFKLDLRWPGASKGEVVVSDFKLDLHLPS